MLQPRIKRTVYEHPLTGDKAEGQAILVRPINREHGQLERWEVRFIGDRQTCERWIKKED